MTLSKKIISCVLGLFFIMVFWMAVESRGWDKGYKASFKYFPKRQGTIYTFKRPIANPPLFWSEKSQSYKQREMPAYEIIAHASWDRTYSEIPNSTINISYVDFMALIDLIDNDKTIVIETQEAKW